MDLNRPRAKLVERNEVTTDLLVIKLQPEQAFEFKPGQYCTLGLDGIERAYSIASAPHEPLLEIFVELVPHGEFTPRMWDLKCGESMSIRPRAKGIFTLEEEASHHFMLATVTGIAPYMSMIRGYVHRGGRGHRFYVLVGASYQDELTYHEELAQLAAQHEGCIKFVPTVSRPEEERNAGWQGARGRVNLIAEEYYQKFDLPNDDTVVYACGHPGMIAGVKAKVARKGWKFKEERFWKA